MVVPAMEKDHRVEIGQEDGVMSQDGIYMCTPSLEG